MNFTNAFVRPPQSIPCCQAPLTLNIICSVLWRQSRGLVPCSLAMVDAMNFSRSLMYCFFSGEGGGAAEPSDGGGCGSTTGGCGTWHFTPVLYTCRSRARHIKASFTGQQRDKPAVGIHQRLARYLALLVWPACLLRNLEASRLDSLDTVLHAWPLPQSSARAHVSSQEYECQRQSRRAAYIDNHRLVIVFRRRFRHRDYWCRLIFRYERPLSSPSRQKMCANLRCCCDDLDHSFVVRMLCRSHRCEPIEVPNIWVRAVCLCAPACL